MKILTLVFSIGPGGTERAAVNYAVAYQQFGHDSRVLVAGAGYDRKPELDAAGVVTILLQESRQTQEAVLAELRAWGPDIIHLHNYTDAYLPFLDKLKREGTKVVETNVFSRPHYEAGYRKVDLSLQLSRWGLWKYSRWMQGAAWKPAQAVIPYIMMGERFTEPDAATIRSFRHRHGIPDGAFVAGRIGQAHPSKWDPRLLDIMEQTIRRGNAIWFFLVGLPPVYRQELLKKSPLVRSRVVLVDEIKGDEQLSLYYRSLQCMVHLSAIGESFGYVLAEALYCRVPVITLLTPFRDNAQYEVVGHEVGGVCCSTVKDCTAALMKMSSDDNWHASLRNPLPAWIENRFSAAAVVPGLITLYEQLLQDRVPAAPDESPLITEVCARYGRKAFWLRAGIRIVHHHRVYRFLQFLKKRRS